MNIAGLRNVGLALVTLVGAAHLSTAEATPLKSDACDDNAAGFAAGFCAGKGHDDWGSVTYTCNGGTAQIVSVTCVDQADAPQTPQSTLQ